MITNNEMMRAAPGFGPGDEFVCGDVARVITRRRDLIHQGWELLTHPMAGSLKPGENPFRTVILQEGDGALDFRSLSIIESAIESTRKFEDRWSMLLDAQDLDDRLLRIRDDFMTIDMSLIVSGGGR